MRVIDRIKKLEEAQQSNELVRSSVRELLDASKLMAEGIDQLNERVAELEGRLDAKSDDHSTHDGDSAEGSEDEGGGI